jgi:hypothetical protein
VTNISVWFGCSLLHCNLLKDTIKFPKLVIFSKKSAQLTVISSRFKRGCQVGALKRGSRDNGLTSGSSFGDENRRVPIGFGIVGVDLAEPGSRERSIFYRSLS